MTRIEAMSARQEAAMARVEADRARIEAQVARVRMMPVAFNTLEIPVVACPRMRINVPRVRVPAGARDSGSGGAGRDRRWADLGFLFSGKAGAAKRLRPFFICGQRWDLDGRLRPGRTAEAAVSMILFQPSVFCPPMMARLIPICAKRTNILSISNRKMKL